MTRDRPVLGITLMLGFCAIAPFGDAIAKLLGQSLPVSQLLLSRFAVQAAVLVPLVWASTRTLRMSPRHLRLTALRTALHIVGIGAMFTGLKYLPLADAIAIAFVMPFIMLILGSVLLGEEVGKRRVVACLIGFAGTLLVIQPSFASVGWHAFWPLLVALVFALFMLVTRMIAKETDPVALQAVSGVMATTFLLPLIALGQFAGSDALTLVAPSPQQLALLITIGLLGTLAHLLMTWSLRYAPSATLAPMQYIEIPFAVLYGWMIFRDFPNGIAALGICVTIGAGLYVILRERAIARHQAPETTG